MVSTRLFFGKHVAQDKDILSLLGVAAYANARKHLGLRAICWALLFNQWLRLAYRGKSGFETYWISEYSPQDEASLSLDGLRYDAVALLYKSKGIWIPASELSTETVSIVLRQGAKEMKSRDWKESYCAALPQPCDTWMKPQDRVKDICASFELPLELLRFVLSPDWFSPSKSPDLLVFWSMFQTQLN